MLAADPHAAELHGRAFDGSGMTLGERMGAKAEWCAYFTEHMGEYSSPPPSTAVVD